jgi:hypothetical protein
MIVSPVASAAETDSEPILNGVPVSNLDAREKILARSQHGRFDRDSEMVCPRPAKPVD